MSFSFSSLLRRVRSCLPSSPVLNAAPALLPKARSLGRVLIAGIFVSSAASTLFGPPVVDGAPLELLQVQVITRHGARVPLASNKLPESIRSLPWKCDDIYEDNKKDLFVVREGASAGPERYDEYKKQFLHSYGREKIFGGSCVDGQLTIVGENQMESFGRFLRDRYITTFKFLPENYDFTKMALRSTNTSRTVNTAYYIIRGLYPERKREENVTVSIRNPALEDMYPRSGCTRLDEVKSEIKGLGENVESSKQRVQLFAKIQEESERFYWTTRSTMGSTNILDSFQKHGFNDKLPQGVSPSSYETARQLSGRYYYNVYSNDTAARLGIGRFIGELAQIVDKATQKRVWSAPAPDPIKFFLFSGHDNTIGPLLHAFKVSDGHHPAMGAAILLEIYRHPKTQKHYFQILFYEGKLSHLQMPTCTSSVCELDKFMERAQKLTPVDYGTECGPSTENVQKE